MRGGWWSPCWLLCRWACLRCTFPRQLQMGQTVAAGTLGRWLGRQSCLAGSARRRRRLTSAQGLHTLPWLGSPGRRLHRLAGVLTEAASAWAASAVAMQQQLACPLPLTAPTTAGLHLSQSASSMDSVAGAATSHGP